MILATILSSSKPVILPPMPIVHHVKIINKVNVTKLWQYVDGVIYINLPHLYIYIYIRLSRKAFF